MNNTTMRPRAARARPKRQSRLACSLEQLFKNAGEVNKWRSGKTDDLRGEDQEMDVSGKCESALDAPSGSRGQGLAGRGGGGGVSAHTVFSGGCSGPCLSLQGWAK